MLTVTRRGLLALGGTGGAAVLAGCGATDDRRAEGDDQALLGDAMQAEADLQAAYDDLSAGRDGAEVVNQARDASAARQSELRRLGAPAPATSSGQTATSENNGFDSSEAAGNAAIAAYRQAAGLLSTTDGRAATMGFLAQVAAELAAIRGLFGQPQAPEAFVTGGTANPFQAEAEETTTTTTTTDEQ